MATFTSNYDFEKPTINGDRDVWGGYLNSALDKIDTAIKAVNDANLTYNSTTKAVAQEVNFTHATDPKIKGNTIATQAWVTQAIAPVAAALAIPSGLIAMWSGTVASIPSGWRLCNGSFGTPDLRDKFVLGAGGTRSPGATGGSSSHDHGGFTANHTLTTGQIPAHKHGLNDPKHGHNIQDPGHRHGYQRPNSTVIFSEEPGTRAYVQPLSDANSDSSTTGISIVTSFTGISMDNAGGGGAHRHTLSSSDHTPVFYAVAFIMKT